MRFALPHMLWLLILVPAIAAWFIYAIGKRRELLSRFGSEKALNRYQLSAATAVTWFRHGLFLLGATALIIALARPQWGYHERRIVSRGVDMMIAIDTSTSMMARDFTPDRLTRAKELLRNLIWEAQGARVGVEAFSGASVIMCPLTLDYNMASTALKAVDVNTVSAQGTNIASAINAALGAFEISGGNDRILILLTDGEQTEELDKLTAAVDKAANEGMRIFAIGIGTPQGATIPTLRGPKRDSSGNIVTTKMDFSKLQEITRKTKGEAIRAEKIGASEIAEITAKLSQFKGQKQLDKTVRIYHDRYSWFLAAAVICLTLEALLRGMRHFGWRRRRRIAAGVIVAGGLLAAAPQSGFAYPGEAFVRAREAYQKFNAGEYDQAMALYQRAADLNPADAQVKYNLGASAARAKKIPEAKRAFRSVYDPANPRLNAEALFGAATLDHHEVRETIKSKKEEWTKNLVDPGEAGTKAKTEVNEAIEKLKAILQEYQKSILAKSSDVDMKANYELAKKDLQELEKLLEENQPKQQPQQKPQDQQNQDKKDQDKNKQDQDKQGQGKPDQQQGQQGENKKDKQDQQDQQKKADDQKQNQPQQGQGQQTPTPTPSDQGKEQQNQAGQQKEDQNQPGKEGDQKQQESQPDKKGQPTPTPTPSPTPGNTPGPGQGQSQPGGPGAQGTPVPVGQMSPSDVDRLLNTLPPEDQQALQLMFGAGDSRQDDMKNDW